MNILFLCLIAYVLGNISGSLLIGKILYNKDIREYGSGNAGMTNALRTFGKKAGAITFGIDFLKGLLAAYTGSRMMGEFGIMLAGIFVVLGHDWPILFKFKGGKGIATSFGVLVLATPGISFIMIVIFITIVVLTKYVSLGSVLAALTGVLFGAYFFLTARIYLSFMFLVLGLLTIFKHRGNIWRLVTGEENKIKNIRSM